MGVEVTSTFVFAADGDSLVGVTTLDAPRGRLVRVPLAATDPQTWQTLVAEGDAVLSQPTVTGDEVWVVATKDAADTVRRFAADGTPHGIVDGLPDLIAVTSLDADRASGRAFLVVDSFEAPTTVWNASAAAVAEPWFPDVVAGGAVPSMLVSQVEYGSADGTEIGMFLIHRDDVAPGPATPVILNGYGGFAITETPIWSPQIAAWCAAGGIYAIVDFVAGWSRARTGTTRLPRCQAERL